MGLLFKIIKGRDEQVIRLVVNNTPTRAVAVSPQISERALPLHPLS